MGSDSAKIVILNKSVNNRKKLFKRVCSLKWNPLSCVCAGL